MSANLHSRRVGTATAIVTVMPPDGIRRPVSLERLATEPIETYLDQRPIPRFKDQLNVPGWYWSSTDARPLRYESYLESRWLTVFDFRGDVIGISTQPLHICGQDLQGAWEHDPDIFLRMDGGTGCVVDVRRSGRAVAPRIVLQSARTRRLCAAAGLDYQVVTERDLDPVIWANIEWLSGYRREAAFPVGMLDALLEHASEPIQIGRLVTSTPTPAIARAAVMHLCWHHRLAFDLTMVLEDTTEVVQVRGER